MTENYVRIKYDELNIFIANILENFRLNKEMIRRIFRILGLISVMSWMSIVLIAWICANIEGYVYFAAGEPNAMIKYPEWILGIIGIMTSLDYFQEEIRKCDKELKEKISH